MKKVNIPKYAFNTTENVMPMPLDYIRTIENNGYDEQTEKELFALLQSGIYKILKPYVDRALKDEDYFGSPIYNGHIDRDTIGSIVDKAIYYAEQEIPAIAEIVENVDESEFGKDLLLRSIVQQIVLYEMFFVLRPLMQNEINYIEPDTEEETNTENNSVMPMPLNSDFIA